MAQVDSPIGRIKSLLFLLKESFNLLQSLLVFGYVEIFLNNSNEHIQDDDWPIDQSKYYVEVGQLTICEDKPENTERSRDPGRPPYIHEIGGAVHYSRPVFTREYLVHSEERIVYRKEGHHKGFTILIWWYLSPKELCCKYGGEECK